jgi:hypothetical protein
MQKTIDDLQSQVQKLQQEGTDSQTVVEDLQNQLRDFQQAKETLAEQHKTATDRLESTIEELQDKSRGLKETHAAALAQKDQDSQSIGAVVEDLQTKVSTLQQQLEDEKMSKDEGRKTLEDAIASLKSEAEAMKETTEQQAQAKDNENRDLSKVGEDLQAKIQEHQKAAEDARSQTETEASSISKVVDGLQNELQVLQHKLQDERSARERSDKEKEGVQELHDRLSQAKGELQAKHELITQQHDELRITHETLVARQQELQSSITEYKQQLAAHESRIEELQISQGDAEKAKLAAEVSLLEVRNELEGLQKVLDTFAHDSEEKEAHHSKAVVKLRQELQDSHEAEVLAIRNAHATEVAALNAKLVSKPGESVEDLQKKLGHALGSKEILERKLGEITMQHNRELEEETQQHEESYRALQTSYSQLKGSQQKMLGDESAKFETIRKELLDTIAVLTGERDKAVSALGDENIRSTKDISEQHATQLDALKESMTSRIEAAVLEKEQAHAAEIAALKVNYIRGQEDAIAGLKLEHARKLEEMAASLKAERLEAQEEAIAAEKAQASIQAQAVLDAQNASQSQQREQTIEATSAEIPSVFSEPKHDGTPSKKGLTHVFVHQTTDSDNASAGAPMTPQNYDSDNEDSYSPTPSHPRGGPRAGSEAIQHKLKQDNDSLTLALKAAQDEIALLQNFEAAPSRAERFSAASSSQSEANGNASTTVPDDSTTSGEDTEGPEPQMTLEGTLESIRLQTEQLLEINDDFMAEQQRWTSRLALRNHTNQQRSLPLRVS